MKTDFFHTGRFLRTVSHLRPRQVIDRLVRRLAPTPKLDDPTPALRTAARSWVPCPGRPATMLGSDKFRFLNREAALGELSGWNDESLPKLWLYHLHYFDDLLADEHDTRAGWHENLIARWVAENPPMRGNGWEPYVLSRRIVNWIGYCLTGHALAPEALDSLAKQARALEGTLEYHLLGNHLFANARALVFAGAFFEGEEATRWLERGLAILNSEFVEQILTDGGHFELSPMYHAIVLEDVIDLIQLASIYPETLAQAKTDQRWADRAHAMVSWLGTMTHPDGDIAFFNDGAIGQARRYAELAGYLGRFVRIAETGEPVSRHLEPSGYGRLVAGPWVAFMDIAEVGPSYLPGHAHADTLSVEISLDGKRLVTNGGTSVYAPGASREMERGTASHATVTVDDQNSSETWASFRVGRRAHVFGAEFRIEPDRTEARGSHDGYRHLAGKPVHERQVSVTGKTVRIRDRYSATARHDVTARLPLHPSVRSASIRDNGWDVITEEGRAVRIAITGPVVPAIESGYYAPEFGVRIKRLVLAWHASGVDELDITIDIVC